VVMGVLDKIRGRHPDPQVRYEKEQRKKKLKADVEKAHDEAYRKARIQRAKQEGRRKGLQGGGSTLKRVGSAMDSVQGLMVGDDFNFGLKKKVEKTTPSQKYVVVKGKAYPVASSSQSSGSKKKNKRNPMWDLI
jgi:hypothetical protein